MSQREKNLCQNLKIALHQWSLFNLAELKQFCQKELGSRFAKLIERHIPTAVIVAKFGSSMCWPRWANTFLLFCLINLSIMKENSMLLLKYGLNSMVKILINSIYCVNVKSYAPQDI